MPKIFLQRLEGRLGEIGCQFTQIRFLSSWRQTTWAPAINAYRCRDGFTICVDLAGVPRSHLDLSVEPRRLWLRGHRLAPEPDETEGQPLQVLSLEIDHGPFAREVVLPEDVAVNEVRAEQHDGLLWIHLPLRLPE